MSSIANQVINGSCLCGIIRYQVRGKPINTALCFCTNCKKSTGSVGMANSWYQKEHLTFIDGLDSLNNYRDKATDSGATVERSFCAKCGSTLTAENKVKFPGAVIVPVGSMELGTGQTWEPNLEYFCKRKADWFETVGETKKFVEL